MDKAPVSSLSVLANDAPGQSLAVARAAPAAVQRLSALTALRFFGAAAIVLHHTRGYMGIPLTFWQSVALPQGVSLFFVLSGFILTYAYRDLDRRGVGHFLIRRFARIWPMHIATFLLAIFVTWMSSRSPVKGPPIGVAFSSDAALWNLTLFHAWIPSTRIMLSFNAVSWSLSVEWFFYLCLPLLLRYWRRTWIAQLGFTLLLAIITISVANHRAGLTSLSPLVYYLPVARLWEFTVGVATAQAFITLRHRIHFTRWFGTLLETLAIAGTLIVSSNAMAWADSARRLPGIGVSGGLLAGNVWVRLHPVRRPDRHNGARARLAFTLPRSQAAGATRRYQLCDLSSAPGFADVFRYTCGRIPHHSCPTALSSILGYTPRFFLFLLGAD